MNRRRFLHRIGFASLVAASAITPLAVHGQSPDDPPIETGTGNSYSEVLDTASGTDKMGAEPQMILGRMLKGTTDGQVLESLDGGAAWHTIANFGKHCSVARLLHVHSEVLALIYTQGHSFTLHSGNCRVWHSKGAAQVSA